MAYGLEVLLHWHMGASQEDGCSDEQVSCVASAREEQTALPGRTVRIFGRELLYLGSILYIHR